MATNVREKFEKGNKYVVAAHVNIDAGRKVFNSRGYELPETMVLLDVYYNQPYSILDDLAWLVAKYGSYVNENKNETDLLPGMELDFDLAYQEWLKLKDGVKARS
ncbi:MAG TPA: hypothetical protein VLH19_05195 [Patescibacteria group bacterium]|nr:hypothetical protein [Patescibacteria group bacterium]